MMNRILLILLLFMGFSACQPASPARPLEEPSSRASASVRDDLAPTLARIRAGGHFPHRNDGAVFQNRERRLPERPRGYYREWVHPTPGVSGPGPRRIVTGRDGEIYYSSDHYKSFTRIE